MTRIKVYAPDGLTGRDSTSLAPLSGSLTGRTIIALDNGKPGAAELLAQTGELLARRTGAEFRGTVQKGSAATPCEEAALAQIVSSAEIVLTGTAD